MLRVRWPTRLLRRSSNTASTIVASSGCTVAASPCTAATAAAAAASSASVLRPRPRDSSRTRAVAVVGTSWTVSPRASSHRVRWQPSPRAFSTAQRRCGNCRAQLSSCR
jgi:hypothetical protein